jgi:hypothetical protein
MKNSPFTIRATKKAGFRFSPEANFFLKNRKIYSDHFHKAKHFTQMKIKQVENYFFENNVNMSHFFRLRILFTHLASLCHILPA